MGADKGKGKETYESIGVIRVDGCAAILCCELDSRLHDAANIVALDVDPVLALPAVQALAVIVRIELVRILAPVFAGSGAEVADDLLVLVLQGTDGRRLVVEEINVDGSDARTLSAGKVVKVGVCLVENDVPRSSSRESRDVATLGIGMGRGKTDGATERDSQSRKHLSKYFSKSTSECMDERQCRGSTPL
jgi:hypothetical protein